MAADEVLIDTNVLLDIFTNNSKWINWSLGQLEKIKTRASLIINPIVYSELSIGFERIEELENSLYLAGIKTKEIPREGLFLAGKVFLKYRKNQGPKLGVLPDFFIAAHAAIIKAPLLTRDVARVKYYFPSVKLICPT